MSFPNFEVVVRSEAKESAYSHSVRGYPCSRRRLHRRFLSTASKALCTSIIRSEAFFLNVYTLSTSCITQAARSAADLFGRAPMCWGLRTPSQPRGTLYVLLLSVPVLFLCTIVKRLASTPIPMHALVASASPTSVVYRIFRAGLSIHSHGLLISRSPAHRSSTLARSVSFSPGSDTTKPLSTSSGASAWIGQPSLSWRHVGANGAIA